MLNNVRENRISGFTLANERYVVGERVKETVIYDGGETYTLITERKGCERVEYKRLETFEQVMGMLFLEMVEDTQALICVVS
jgi:hypothetical protein